MLLLNALEYITVRTVLYLYRCQGSGGRVVATRTAISDLVSCQIEGSDEAQSLSHRTQEIQAQFDRGFSYSVVLSSMVLLYPWPTHPIGLSMPSRPFIFARPCEAAARPMKPPNTDAHNIYSTNVPGESSPSCPSPSQSPARWRWRKCEPPYSIRFSKLHRCPRPANGWKMRFERFVHVLTRPHLEESLGQWRKK